MLVHRYYKPPYIQRGGGFLSAIGRIFTPILKKGAKFLSKPIVKSALKSAKEAAIDSAINIGSAALRGESISDQAKEELVKAKHAVAQNLERLKKRGRKKRDYDDDDDDDDDDRIIVSKKKRSKKKNTTGKKKGKSVSAPSRRRPRYSRDVFS